MCRSAFISIFGISIKRTRTVLDKQTVIASVKKDKRGNRKPITKISDEWANFVREHINALSKLSSHYSRAKNPNRKYLTTGMNINAVYEKYLEWMRENHADSEIAKNWF